MAVLGHNNAAVVAAATAAAGALPAVAPSATGCGGAAAAATVAPAVSTAVASAAGGLLVAGADVLALCDSRDILAGGVWTGGVRAGGEAEVADAGDVGDDATAAFVVAAVVPTPASRATVDGAAAAAASVTFLLVLAAASSVSAAAAAVAVLSGTLGWPSSGDGAILERGGRCGAAGLQRCGVLGLSTATRPTRTHSHSRAHWHRATVGWM